MGKHVPTKRPKLPVTVRPRPTASSTEEPTQQEPTSSDGFNYVPLLVIFILLLLALCIFVLWYLYKKNNPLVAQWKDYVDKRICKKKIMSSATVKTNPGKSAFGSIMAVPPLGNSLKLSTQDMPQQQQQQQNDSAPVPPPRLKRNSRVKEMSPDESSIA